MKTAILKSAALKTVILVCLLFLSAFVSAEELRTVKSGDTVFSISKEYGVSVDDVLFLNGIEDPRKIYAGQKLRIPSGPIRAVPTKEESKQPEFIEYTAKRGDTLYGIARKYGTTYQKLLANNKLSANYVLKAGDKIKVPVKKAPAPLPQPAAKPEKTIQIANAASAPKTQSAPKLQSAPKTESGKNSYKSLLWPVKAKETSYMEGRLGGIIITGEQKEAVRSLTAGTVVAAGPYRGFGRVVIVKTDPGYKYIYGGCESLAVKVGDRISPGTEVGTLGVDARSSKPQLTLIVYHDDKPIDPAKAPRA